MATNLSPRVHSIVEILLQDQNQVLRGLLNNSGQLSLNPVPGNPANCAATLRPRWNDKQFKNGLPVLQGNPLVSSAERNTEKPAELLLVFNLAADDLCQVMIQLETRRLSGYKNNGRYARQSTG